MRAASLLLAVLLAGCTCDLNKCEELVGACEKQKEIVQGPPQKIFINIGKVVIPESVPLTVELWTSEAIRADPVGYEEALISDLLNLVEANASIIDYLERLEAARLRLEEQANP
jgi:hypothetical protein